MLLERVRLLLECLQKDGNVFEAQRPGLPFRPTMDATNPFQRFAHARVPSGITQSLSLVPAPQGRQVGAVRGYIEEGQQFTDNAASTLLAKVASLIEGSD